MKKITLGKMLDSILNWLESIQLFSLVAVVLLVFFQIVVREVFNVGVAWIYEIARFFQVTLVFLGVPILLRNDENIQITALFDCLPKKIKKIVSELQFIITFVVVIILLISNYLFLDAFFMVKTATLGMPNGLFFISTVIGLLVTFLVLVEKCIIKIKGSKK